MKYTNLKSLFTAIADAIRSKEGSTAGIIAHDFPERISAIETHNTEAEDALVSGERLTVYVNNRVSRVRTGTFTKVDVGEIVLDSAVVAEDGAFESCNTVTKVSCKALDDIGDGAFVSCTLLRILEIHGAGCVLKMGVFNGNGNLTALIIRNEDADRLCHIGNNNIFDGDETALTDTPIGKGTGYIYVPASMVDAYKADTGWSTYASQIRAIEDYPEICG